MDSSFNYYCDIMKNIDLPFPPGYSQTSVMALMQHNLHKYMCALPKDPSSPFLTTLYAKSRSFKDLEAFSTVMQGFEKIQKMTSVIDVIKWMHIHGSRVLFHVQYDPDLRHPEQNILYCRIADPILADHRLYLKSLFKHLDLPFPKTNVFATEKRLFAERPETYELQSTACFNPVLLKDQPWLRFYFEELDASIEVSIDSFAFFDSIGDNLKTMGTNKWRDYLLCRWVLHCAPLFSDTYLMIYKFQKDPVEPDESECKSSVACSVWWQDAGYQFVQSDRERLIQARQVVEKLVDDIKGTFRSLLQTSSLQPDTKKVALQKLENMLVLVGWSDETENPVILSDPWFDECIFRGHEWQYKYIIENADTGSDRRRWRWESCTVVNAFYSREANVVYLPAALFYEPLLYIDEEDEVIKNYAAMGCIIAHEIAHGFDYDSRFINGEGLLENWWNPIDERVYMNYVKETVHLYRKTSTLSENMADLIGFLLLWITFKRKIKVVTDTIKQQFFRVFVISQAQLYMPESRKDAKKSDLHALMDDRINIPLSLFEQKRHCYPNYLQFLIEK